MSRRGRSKAPATTGPTPPSLLSKLGSQLLRQMSCGLDDCRDLADGRLRRPQNGRILASRGARPIREGWGLAMGEMLSGCGSWPGSFVGGRRRHEFDGIGLEAIPVATWFCDEWRAVSVVPLPLPLLLRVLSSPRFDSHFAGTPSAASPRCWGVPVDEIHRPGWAGGRWAQRWALRQDLALLATVVFISMALATLGVQVDGLEVRRGGGVRRGRCFGSASTGITVRYTVVMICMSVSAARVYGGEIASIAGLKR